jgi:uncharacterized protein (TIGR02246 family)
MKTLLSTLLAIAVSAPLLVGCRSLCAASSDQDAAQTEREIRAVDSARSAALREGDTAALAALYSDDFLMIASTGEIRTKQDQLRDIGSKLFQHQGPEPKILRIRVEGNMAVVQSESKGELVVNGQPDDVVRPYTRVYVRSNGRWQLTATHISRVTQP